VASLIGRTYPEVRFLIESEHVDAFAAALGLEPGGPIPPTYAAVYALGTTVPQLFADPEAAVDLSRLLHAEQEFEWRRQPERGESVVAQGRVGSDVTRRGMRFLSLETAVVREGEVDPFCLSRALFVIRGEEA